MVWLALPLLVLPEQALAGRRGGRRPSPASPTSPSKSASPSRPSKSTSAATPAAPLIDLPDTPAQLALDPSWIAQELGERAKLSSEPGLARVVALYRQGEAAEALALVVFRFDAPNAAAWRSSTRGGYVDQVEAGVAAACAQAGDRCSGYRRIKRTVWDSEKVPAMDLQLGDASGRLRWIRFLFFRTYAIAAAIEVEAGASTARRDRAQRALKGFTVMPNWQR